MDKSQLLPLSDDSDFDSDWTYSMRRDMQEIIPGLFLGPYAAAMKSRLQYLQQFGITHIVCIRQDIEANFIRPNFPEYFSYMVLDIADQVTENIIKYFSKVKVFVECCFTKGGKVLVHGNAGISRSAAVVIAFIMEKHRTTYREALRHVQRKRFCCNPNEGFARQLMEYEPIYKAKLSPSDGQCSNVNGATLKRKRTAAEDGDEETDERTHNSGDVT